MKLIDLTGKRFGRLTVVERVERKVYLSGSADTRWLCRCDCGTEKIVSSSRLRGGTLSCGCLQREKALHQANDLTGQRFGRLVAIERAPNIGRLTAWRCQCDCGNYVVVRSATLKNGETQSCGCLHSDLLSCRNRTHGKSETRLHKVYKNIKKRCYNTKSGSFENYGGRGITVCDEWLGEDGFQHFWDWAYANGYDENAPRGQCTIDRIDVNGNYCPQNCRWVTMQEQANNKRNNHYVVIDGEKKTLAEWCRVYGASYSAAISRIKKGADPKTAISTSCRKTMRG